MSRYFIGEFGYSKTRSDMSRIGLDAFGDQDVNGEGRFSV